MIDASPSMEWSSSCVCNMTSTEASAAIAMTFVRTEDIGDVTVQLFSSSSYYWNSAYGNSSKDDSGLEDIILTPSMNLATVTGKCKPRGGGTNIGLGLEDSIKKFKVSFSKLGSEDQATFLKARDTFDLSTLRDYNKIMGTPEVFMFFTDNDVNGGNHAASLLNDIRSLSGLDQKMVVFCTTGSNYSVGDPSDAGTFIVAGFDATGPQLVGDFIRRPTHIGAD